VQRPDIAPPRRPGPASRRSAPEAPRGAARRPRQRARPSPRRAMRRSCGSSSRRAGSRPRPGRSGCSCVVVQPTLELADGDQPAPTAPYDPQLVEHVVLQEVHAHTERLRRLPLRQRQPAFAEEAQLLVLLVGVGRDGHRAPRSREDTASPLRDPVSRFGQLLASRPRPRTAWSGFGGRSATPPTGRPSRPEPQGCGGNHRSSAEGEGFEPSVGGLPPQRFSRPPRSTVGGQIGAGKALGKVHFSCSHLARAQ
jgi:hypothetical protein